MNLQELRLLLQKTAYLQVCICSVLPCPHLSVLSIAGLLSCRPLNSRSLLSHLKILPFPTLHILPHIHCLLQVSGVLSHATLPCWSLSYFRPLSSPCLSRYSRLLLSLSRPLSAFLTGLLSSLMCLHLLLRKILPLFLSLSDFRILFLFPLLLFLSSCLFPLQSLSAPFFLMHFQLPYSLQSLTLHYCPSLSVFSLYFLPFFLLPLWCPLSFLSLLPSASIPFPNLRLFLLLLFLQILLPDYLHPCLYLLYPDLFLHCFLL